MTKREALADVSRFLTQARQEAARLADILDPARTRKGYLVAQLDQIADAARRGQYELEEILKHD